MVLMMTGCHPRLLLRCCLRHLRRLSFGGLRVARWKQHASHRDVTCFAGRQFWRCWSQFPRRAATRREMFRFLVWVELGGDVLCRSWR